MPGREASAMTLPEDKAGFHVVQLTESFSVITLRSDCLCHNLSLPA